MAVKSIVVVGSSNTDLIIKTGRIPAPGETIIGGEFITAAGGKGANQAVAAARLGATVSFVARVGKDDFGRRATDNFKREGMDTRFVYSDGSAPSGIAIIIVDKKGENSIVVASGANATLSPSDVDRAMPAIRKAGILLMQLETPLDTVIHAAAAAHEAGVPVILNPAPARKLPQKLLKCITYLTPNESEAALLTGVTVTNENTAREAGELLRRQGVKTVIVTMGSRGALIISDGIVQRVATKKIKAVDTTAAGDAFNGALAVALLSGQKLENAVRFANHAGALSAMKMGAHPSLPTAEEVERFIGKQDG